MTMEKIRMKHTDPTKKTVAMEKEKYKTWKLQKGGEFCGLSQAIVRHAKQTPFT